MAAFFFCFFFAAASTASCAEPPPPGQSGGKLEALASGQATLLHLLLSRADEAAPFDRGATPDTLCVLLHNPASLLHTKESTALQPNTMIKRLRTSLTAGATAEEPQEAEEQPEPPAEDQTEEDDSNDPSGQVRQSSCRGLGRRHMHIIRDPPEGQAL